MNFLEAIESMEQGHKINRPSHRVNDVYWIINNNSIERVFNGGNSLVTCLSPPDYHATDWEVVDEDEEWNLSNCEGFRGSNFYNDVKKCRDLILKDICVWSKDRADRYSEPIENMVTKRFGDLE